MIDRKALDDPRVSLKAKGLLCYLLSKPPDWRPQIADIAKHCSDGEGAIKSALQELKRHGYAVLIKEKSEGGRFEGSRWSIFENPQTTENAVSRLSENLSLSNTKKCTNKVLKSSRFEELNGMPTEMPGIPNIQERLRRDFDSSISKVLGSPENDVYRRQWEERFQQAPWRTIAAFTYLDDDLAEISATNKPPLKNPSGKANWYFLHLDPKTRRLKSDR